MSCIPHLYILHRLFCRRIIIRAGILSVGFVLIISHVSLAENADIGEIKVESRLKEESQDAPSSFVTVIRPSEQNITFENVSEMISTSPGITAKSLGGLGQYTTVSIRGSTPEQVSVYLDGIKMNTASGGAFDFSTIPMESIERIEIIRGGGTAQFGSDAIGGVINIITKEVKKGRNIEALLGGGSFGTFKTSLSYLEKFKKNSLALSWTHLSSEGNYSFKTNPVKLSGAPTGLGGGRTYTRIHNAFGSESVFANWKHDFSDNLKISILNDFFFTDREVPGTEEETTILYPTNPLDADEMIFRNTNSVTLDIESFFTDELGFSAGITNNLNVDEFYDATPAIGNAIDTTTYDYSLGSYFKLNAFLDTDTIDQLITFRYDYRYDLRDDSSPISTANLTGEKTRHTNAIFIQDEISFFDEKITFLPSIRYEKATDLSTNLSYKSGLKIKPVKWLTVKSNFEQAFRYPTFNELYFPDQGYIRGNPNLNKEKSWNLDAGIEIGTKHVSFEASYFRNWVDNLIIFVPISATTIQPVNTFALTIQGGEFALQFNPIKYINGWINYTFLDAHYNSNSNQLPGRPKHEINGYVEFNHNFTNKFGGSIFGRYNYKSEVAINASNTVFLSARSKLDLGINLRFLEYYYFIFTAKNITNVQIYDARGFPLPRRSFFATLGVKWS